MALAIGTAATVQAEDSKPQRAYQIQTKDIDYLRHGDRTLKATLYQPDGKGPFAALLEVHGGHWTAKDRFNNAETAKSLAKSGIVVLSIDFTMPPIAPYPASLQDINYGVRWLKAHATEFNSAPDRVGIYGTSSGGHQVLLAAMRPDDPRYRALPLAEGENFDAHVAFVVSGWGVVDPLARYGLAKGADAEFMIEANHQFWGNEETMSEGSPPRILARGEKVALPPAFLFQGTKDKWTPIETVKNFVDLYGKAGGKIELVLYEGEPHAFVNDHPESPNTPKAIAAMTQFIKTFGAVP
jgi:acetyl esterase/lipase